MKRVILILILAAGVAWPQQPRAVELLPAKPKADQVRILAELGACTVNQSVQQEYIAALEVKVHEWQARAFAAEAKVKAATKAPIEPENK